MCLPLRQSAGLNCGFSVKIICRPGGSLCSISMFPCAKTRREAANTLGAVSVTFTEIAYQQRDCLIY